ncbi:hypothetical protein KPL70_017737 [Citrus sinensis]|nr:hypothetical protein KPL70_017737 [Citrus sinensis]
MNEKACGQIRSCLTKEVKYLVKDEECAVTLWRTLEEKYLVKSPENHLHVMSQVYGFRMKPGVSMHNHVSRFEKLLADLKNLDEDIKDEIKAMILLHSLPDEYSHFVITLIYGNGVIVFKDVCTTLTSLEIWNNDKNSERVSSEGLVSRDWAMEKQKKRGGKNSRSKSRSRNIARDECAFCHEKGHSRKDCPKAQKRDEKKPTAANMARKDEGSDYSLSITPAAYVASSSEWILDTGATYHLCPIKEWFTDFRNLESGAVVMGNNQPCHTMGIGTIRLKMFDGMVRELKEVRFVPALKKNLISVGALEAKGYKVTIEDGTMKFTHGAMVILDVWGPTKTASIGGSHYFVTFVDDFSRRVWVYTMRAKDENGVAERMNRTLLEKVRCMLSNAGLNKKFWAKTVSYASHLVNQLPSAAIRAYYHVKDGKLDPRARKTIFVGFKGEVKGFKLWDLKDKKFVCSRDVTFNEASMMKASSSQQVENKTKEVLQRVEFDATPYVSVSSTSKKGSTMEVTPRVEEETWELVKSPKGKRAIGNKWVYTKKQGSPNQTTPRYKARLVAKDFAQKEGIDYNEVFSSVVKHTCIRILLALVAEYELELAQLDVKTAFLHGDLEEEIYMIQPCGFRVAGKENHVSSKNRDEIEILKKQLASEFEMKDLGDAQRILGIEIRRDKKNGSVWLTQESYLKKVLERFCMDDKTKPVCTPLTPYFKLSSSSCPKSQKECDYMARVPDASAVGSLMYAMLAVKWLLRYLYGTVDVGLLFKKDCVQQCVRYCDSDFAGDLDKRRSTTGYVFILGGGLVSWRLILQSTIALSTTEAEYMAATKAVKEVIWLKGLLGDLGIRPSGIMNYGWLDPKFWVRRQSNRHSHSGSLLKDHFGDEGSLVVGSDLDKFSLRWRIVEKSCT